MGFELDPSYKDVPTRMADFKALHPDGCLRPVNEAEPYRIECIDGHYFIVYVAAAYKHPDDKLPGIGVAWEPFPGRTPYTKDSELQNAETSAWGRAIVAALRSESKAIASAEDVRNRQADDAAAMEQVTQLRADVVTALAPLDEVTQYPLFAEWAQKQQLPPSERLTIAQAEDALEFIATLAPTEETAEGPSGLAPTDTATPAGEGVGSPPSDPAPDPDEPGAATLRRKQAEDIADKAARVQAEDLVTKAATQTKGAK